MLSAIAAAVGFEVVPNWDDWKASMQLVTGRMAGEMILASLIMGAFFMALIFLVRYSDLLTTVFSFGVCTNLLIKAAC